MWSWIIETYLKVHDGFNSIKLLIQVNTCHFHFLFLIDRRPHWLFRLFLFNLTNYRISLFLNRQCYGLNSYVEILSMSSSQFSSVQPLSRVQLFATPWTAEHQAYLSITNSQSLPKLMSIESVMPSSHLIICCPLLLLPSIFPNIRVFSTSAPHNVTLFGNIVVADVICWGHTGTGWTPSPIWLGTFDTKGGIWTWTDT